MAGRTTEAAMACAQRGAEAAFVKFLIPLKIWIEALDFHPDATSLRDDFRFLDAYPRPEYAAVLKAARGDLLGQRLNQIDMALG